MSGEAAVFEQKVASEGLVAGLRYLNDRTPHRFTGVFRYDGEFLRNVALVDSMDPSVRAGHDVRLSDAYCDYLGDNVESVEFSDARSDGRITMKPGNPVLAYCGIVIRDARGGAYGTLCHFDMQPCQPRTSDVPLLREVARVIYESATGVS